VSNIRRVDVAAGALEQIASEEEERTHVAEILQRLVALDACRPALDWLLDEALTLRQAWECCERHDWMVWLVGRAHSHGTLARKRLVQACLRWMEPVCYLLSEESIADLGSVAQWTVGAATIADVRGARDRLCVRHRLCTAAYAAGAAAYAAAARAAGAAATANADAAAARAAGVAAGVADAAAARAAYAAGAAYAAYADVIRASITIDEVCAALGIDPDGVTRE
jgi:hypothetical protein